MQEEVQISCKITDLHGFCPEFPGRFCQLDHDQIRLFSECTVEVWVAGLFLADGCRGTMPTENRRIVRQGKEFTSDRGQERVHVTAEEVSPADRSSKQCIAGKYAFAQNDTYSAECVSRGVASFVLPLGATVNMNGTGIYHGVSTIFIAQVYGIELGLAGLVTVVITATLASIGAAGVPGIGFITLTIVLQALGIPLEGLAMILGVERILDMTRTAVNVTGDSAASIWVAHTEGELNIPDQAAQEG